MPLGQISPLEEAHSPHTELYAMLPALRHSYTSKKTHNMQPNMCVEPEKSPFEMTLLATFSFHFLESLVKRPTSLPQAALHGREPLQPALASLVDESRASPQPFRPALGVEARRLHALLLGRLQEAWWLIRGR